MATYWLAELISPAREQRLSLVFSGRNFWWSFRLHEYPELFF